VQLPSAIVDEDGAIGGVASAVVLDGLRRIVPAPFSSLKVWSRVKRTWWSAQSRRRRTTLRPAEEAAATCGKERDVGSSGPLPVDESGLVAPSSR
jgi:hypothetical protein